MLCARILVPMTAVRLLVIALTAGPAAADQTYRYRISWNGIPAANATVTLVENAGPDKTITRLRIEAQTNRFVDLFWSLRAESLTEVDAQTLRTRFFEYDRRINGRPEVTRVEAEADGILTGRYARPGRYYLKEVNDAEVLDPIAAVLRARRELPAVGGTASYQVFTGEDRYRIDLYRRAVETIDVPAGRFLAARLDPSAFEWGRPTRDTRVRRLSVWVAEAAPHELLRVRSEVFIGAVYLDLLECSSCLQTRDGRRQTAD
jgi:uncharacterized protein DUF3108